ncbi:hypothetical protein SAMN03159343_2018 [Klenkia marina]|uniref:Uncharacterized protein n=1 Tax=Klenkia marina TaxID=1960309 RepID=A0A1G4Y5J7_9ACTN|nr:hypothetical protein [Klenkia marina]SCX48666.1 hypothetical protein SAMN03159343_2018 [Klenkia marina]
MLILTPSGLETGAERAFFAELGSWDTGGSVRGALVASLALSDGPMDRRISDAVVLVPEGVAVVRVVEVVRQSGVVTVLPEGSWTIGPGAGPGDVLRLAGGGSTPLDGLMRAGMEVAVRLRRAGLEPGRIARLTVLHGDLRGLVPADGDLGEGDQVSLLESRSLLLGIARASRYAGTDNPRLWTTADVRAALEALGVGGRSPAVEELNGEGFPYSPYVLRRRELLAPATLANQPAVRSAGPTATDPGRLDPVPGHDPGYGHRGQTGGPLVDPAAAAALAAAAAAEQQAHPEVPAQLRTAGGDTVALPGPGAPQTAAAPDQPPQQAPGWQSTQQIRPVSPGPAPAPEPAPPAADGPEETGGIGGIFGARDEPPAHRAPAAPAAPAWSAQSWVAEPQSEPPSEPEVAPPGRRRRSVVLVAAAVALLLVVLGGVLVAQGLGGDDDGGTQAAPTSTSAPTTSSGPTTPSALPVGTVQQGGDTDYTLQVVSYDSSCREHSYGAVTSFFATTDCLGLSRSLWSAEVGGQPAVVSVSRVTMPDPARVQALLSLTDVSGTGNVSDLLREGSRYEGGPEALSGAEYASEAVDDVAVVVETSWVGEPGEAGALQQLADDAVELDPTR